MKRAFFDSNVLLYAINSDDPRGPTAAGLLERGGAISIQCLNEFASVARRKLQWPWPSITTALERVAVLCAPIVRLDLDLHRLGLRIAEQFKVSVYDGMIIAAALKADCDTLYSEDMHAGLVVDGRLTIVNPFA